MCISNVKSSLFKYCCTTNFSSSLITASSVGPGVVLVPLGALEVAAVVVPAGGVAPCPPSVVPPLASPVCVPVLVTEGQAVVALAPPVVLVLVVESLVLVVEALVLEVAVEPVVVVHRRVRQRTLCQALPRQELASFSFHWCCRC